MVFLLTILTQIGGLLWFVLFLFFKFKKPHYTKARKITIFGCCYLLATLLIIPLVAPLFGRVPLPILKSNLLRPHSYMTCLANRHYVTKTLKAELEVLAKDIHQDQAELKLSYLDACFPFIDGFPLLPHLSHNDGRKIDLAFYYTKDGKRGNLKPAHSGYGVYEGPRKNERNQTQICKGQNYWQYDFSKFLTFGSRTDLEFDPIQTRELINSIAKRKLTHKILLEPHLKSRLKLGSDKIRFQGCHSVRHDDHVHYQVYN